MMLNTVLDTVESHNKNLVLDPSKKADGRDEKRQYKYFFNIDCHTVKLR